MSLITLPTLIEDTVTTYLSASATTGYSIHKSFSVEDFTLPAIIVGANQFTELEPGTGVFSGKLGVGIVTQIDDVADVLESHDATVSIVYDLLQPELLIQYFNSQQNGHMWGIYIESFAQGKEDRSLISTIEYVIKCQSLGI